MIEELMDKAGSITAEELIHLLWEQDDYDTYTIDIEDCIKLIQQRDSDRMAAQAQELKASFANEISANKMAKALEFYATP